MRAPPAVGLGGWPRRVCDAPFGPAMASSASKRLRRVLGGVCRFFFRGCRRPGEGGPDHERVFSARWRVLFSFASLTLRETSARAWWRCLSWAVARGRFSLHPEGVEGMRKQQKNRAEWEQAFSFCPIWCLHSHNNYAKIVPVYESMAAKTGQKHQPFALLHGGVIIVGSSITKRRRRDSNSRTVLPVTRFPVVRPSPYDGRK